jgi:L-cysteine S-thiosulfotransferase
VIFDRDYSGLSKALIVGLYAITLNFGVTSRAQTSAETVREIERYRQMLADGNPAELHVARGEALWMEARGPNKVTLEKCDLGLGAGVVKGAYTQLPRYFPDVRKVMDVEQRLLHCLTTLQGFRAEQFTKQPFGDGPDKKSDMEALTAFITDESRGSKMNVGLNHAEEKTAYALGKKLFFHRGGPHDFSCASCHASDEQRIRLQDLPNLLKQESAQKAYGAWPAYRVSQGELRTMQHRLWDCYRQQRFPEPAYASDAITALTMYLAVNANGGTYNAPALKR